VKLTTSETKVSTHFASRGRRIPCAVRVATKCSVGRRCWVMRVRVALAVVGVMAPVTGLVYGCSGGSAPPSGPRHFDDALGRQCTEIPATSYFTVAGCQGLHAFGASTSCQVPPMPDGGCTGSKSCWTLRAIIAFEDAGLGDYVGAPSLPADGGGVEFAALCSACCYVDDAGPTHDNESNCAAIPCKAASDCPLESCGCSDGFCQ
jgi:hypothetical protein